MRLDKFLKVSRIIKRRSIAKEITDKGKVKINEKIAKPSSVIKVGDILELDLTSRIITIIVLDLKDYCRAEEAETLYEIKNIIRQKQ